MSNSVCMLHTDRPATSLCTECQRPLCQECTQMVAGKPVCQTCLTAIRSRVATQLNAEAASTPPVHPQPLQPPALPYGAPGAAYPPAGQAPVTPAYGAPRTDLAGNAYAPPPGSQYGAQQNPAYPSQSPGGPAPQPPYGAQPGYGAPAAQQPPYGQQAGYGQPAPGQPGYNPSGPGQQPYPPQTQQPGYPQQHNPQAPYGTPPQPYPGQNPYAAQQSRPLAAPMPATSAGNYVLGVVFGLITAVVGAGLYIWLVMTTHMMIGYMALGIGFGVGWAVKMGARFPSQGAGIVAAALTMLSILPGQLLFYKDPSDILFTLLFLFIGCRWAYRIASTGK